MGLIVILLFSPLAFLFYYVVGQIRTQLRLISLLRQRDRIITKDLATRCALHLFWMPFICLFGLSAMTMGDGYSPGTDPVMLLVFSRPAVGLALLSYTVAGLFMSYYLARAEYWLYRGLASLAPMIVMAMICFHYSAGVAILGVGTMLQGTLYLVLAGTIVFFLPALPLMGLVLLMIHVGRNLPRRQETQWDF